MREGGREGGRVKGEDREEEREEKEAGEGRWKRKRDEVIIHY